MADLIYPDYLPIPRRSGYGFKHQPSFRKDQMTNGRFRSQRIADRPPSNPSLEWLMSDTQAALFELWFFEALNGGQAWFQMPLRTPLATLETYRCRFQEMYDGPHLDDSSNLWRITATLELEFVAVLPEEMLAFPEALLEARILDLAANREWPLE